MSATRLLQRLLQLLQKGPQMLRATSTHQPRGLSPPELDLRLHGEAPFGCSSKVLPQIYVCRPSGLHHVRRWHISSAVTPPKSNSHRNPQSLALWRRFHTRVTALPNQAIRIYGKTGLTDTALNAVLHCLNSGTRHPFNRLLTSKAL